MKASLGQPIEPTAVAAGGSACRPRIFGIGADPGHHEQRKPSTSVPTEASGWRSTFRRSSARLTEQTRQPRYVHSDPARLVLGQHFGLQRFGLVVPGDIGERLSIGVSDDVAAGDLVGAPGRGEAAVRHGFRRSGTYRFHFTGVTASGVPLLELIQPVAVSLHGLGSL
jgi:hypothetical protein